MKRRANPSREETGRRYKRLHFIALEYPTDQEQGVLAAIADLKIPDGCRLMGIDEDLMYELADSVGISCSKKRRLFRLVSTLMGVANLITDRAKDITQTALAVCRQERDHFERRYFWKKDQLRFLNKHTVTAMTPENIVFQSQPGRLENLLDEQIPEPDPDANQTNAEATR